MSVNNNLKTHFELVLLYKKVIESAIELENQSTTGQSIEEALDSVGLN